MRSTEEDIQSVTLGWVVYSTTQAIEIGRHLANAATEPGRAVKINEFHRLAVCNDSILLGDLTFGFESKVQRREFRHPSVKSWIHI